MHTCNLARSELAQFAAKNLTGGADGKLVHDREPLRQFELRNVATQQEGLYLVQIDGLTIHRNQTNAQAFSPNVSSGIATTQTFLIFG